MFGCLASALDSYSGWRNPSNPRNNRTTFSKFWQMISSSPVVQVHRKFARHAIYGGAAGSFGFGTSMAGATHRGHGREWIGGHGTLDSFEWISLSGIGFWYLNLWGKSKNTETFGAFSLSFSWTLLCWGTVNYSVPVYSIFRHPHPNCCVKCLLVALWSKHRRGVHSDKQLAIIIGNCIILYYSFWLVVSSLIYHMYIYMYLYISYISYLSIYLSIHPSIDRSIYLSIYLYILSIYIYIL